MVDLQTAIDEINTGKIEFDYKDNDCCTTEGEVVIFLKRLAELEKADVEEVKHAHWLDDIQKVTTVAGVEFNGFVGYRCSLCGRREPSKEPYCNCGAKMDGGKADGNL